MVHSDVLKCLTVPQAGFHNISMCTSCFHLSWWLNGIITVRITPLMIKVFIYLHPFPSGIRQEWEVADPWETLKWCTHWALCPIQNAPEMSIIIWLEETKKGNTNGNWREDKSLGGVTLRKLCQLWRRFKRRETPTFICGPSSEGTQGGHVWWNDISKCSPSARKGCKHGRQPPW